MLIVFALCSIALYLWLLDASMQLFFGLDTWPTLLQWFGAFGQVETPMYIIINLLFVLSSLFFCSGVLNLLERIYLSLFGRAVCVMYLGNRYTREGTYVDYKTPRALFTGRSDAYLNYSFEALGVTSDRIKGLWKGRVVNRRALSLPGILLYALLCCYMAALVVTGLICAVSCVISVYLPELPVAGMNPEEILNYLLRPLGIHPVVAVMGLMVYLIVHLLIEVGFHALWAKFHGAPRTLMKIAPRSERVTGQVVSFDKIYRKKDSSSKNQTDTGYRDITFQFEQLYTHPVYVSLRYHIDELSAAYNAQVEQQAREKSPMELVVKDDGSLQLPQGYSQSF
ncbi:MULTISPECIES: hypothetical protein [Aliagarivorans]|uniref:hypothetical protein n=1 Tax=Aliagarivorans TaxID=882379 RepID=UPI0003FAF776|nr:MULTISPECIES: hypothetical protein [Aliagarivorans]